jgi:hypothetical protein
MFFLWTEHHDVGVFFGSDTVSGWPVEQIADPCRLFFSTRVNCSDGPLHNVTLVRTLTAVAIKSMKQLGYVSPGSKRKIFCPHLIISSNVAKFGLLPGCSAGHIDLNWHIFFCYAHDDIILVILLLGLIIE